MATSTSTSSSTHLITTRPPGSWTHVGDETPTASQASTIDVMPRVPEHIEQYHIGSPADQVPEGDTFELHDDENHSTKKDHDKDKVFRPPILGLASPMPDNTTRTSLRDLI
eukprot:6301730-Pyramimonas_sp.AAC.1